MSNHTVIAAGQFTVTLTHPLWNSGTPTTIGGFKLYYLGIGDDEEDMAIDEITNNESTIVAIYTTNGIRIATIQKGVNILRMSDGTTVKVVRP